MLLRKVMFKDIFCSYPQLFDQTVTSEKEKIGFVKIKSFSSLQNAWALVMTNSNVMADCKMKIYFKKFQYLLMVFLLSLMTFFLGSLFENSLLDLAGLLGNLFSAVFFAALVIDDFCLKKDSYLAKKYEYADFVKDIIKIYTHKRELYKASFVVRQKYELPYDLTLALERDLGAVKLNYLFQLEELKDNILVFMTSMLNELRALMLNYPKRLLKYTFSVIIKLH